MDHLVFPQPSSGGSLIARDEIQFWAGGWGGWAGG